MINPNKFYERTKLFNDIIYEIFRVESNYRTELSILNLRLSKKVEEHKSNVKKISKKDYFRQSHRIFNTENDLHSSIKSSSSNKSNNFILIEKEENPIIDIIISEGLQQLLNFYKNKHKLISKEVSSLGIILYNYTSQKTSGETKDTGINLEKNEIDFKNNINKLEIAKEKYFDKMNEIELFLHDDEKKINNIENNKINNTNVNKQGNKIKKNFKVLKNKLLNKDKDKDKDNIINENENKTGEEIEKEKISELKIYRQNYKNSLDEINNTKRTYISEINEICNQIQEFNLIENNILFNIFKIFNENIMKLSKDINTYCSMYESNQKIIQDLNMAFSQNLIFNNNINKDYQFEEYNPKYSDMHNKKDLSVIQKMHKLIGFEFDNINQIKNDDLSKEKDNNVLFIILMDKFISVDNKLTDKEKYLMKSLFNQVKYIDEFLNKLNIIRINKKLFYNKENFDILFEFFENILSRVSFSDEKNHELVKLLMILSETFYYKDGDKKVFLNNVLKLPAELNDIKFWIKYIEIEIEKDSLKHNKKKKNDKFEYIVLLSNLTHLREYMGDKDKLKEIIDYFKEKYNFSVDDFDIIKSQLNL